MPPFLRSRSYAFTPKRAAVDVLDRLLVGAREVPQDRRELDLLLVDRRDVPDVADVPRLLLGGLGGLDVAERRAVAHAEEHVGALVDHAGGDALAACGVVVGGRADRREDDLRRRGDAAHAGGEASGHQVPVRVGGRDHDADGAGLRHLGGQDAGEVAALVGRGRDHADLALDEVLGRVVRDRRHAGLLRDAHRDRVVAGRVRDQQAGLLACELAQHALGVVVADVRDRGQLRSDRLGGGGCARDALRVPAVVARLGRGGDRHRRDLGDLLLARRVGIRSRGCDGRTHQSSDYDKAAAHLHPDPSPLST